MKQLAAAAIAATFILVQCSGTKNDGSNAVKVNGTWIPRDQIEQVADAIRQQMAAYEAGEAMFGGGAHYRKTAARQLIANQLMLDVAKKRGIVCDSATVGESLRQFKQRIPPAQLDSELVRMGKTENDLRQQISDGMAVDSLVKLVLASIDEATESECSTFYRENIDKFTAPGRMRARHILLLRKEGAAPEETAAQRRKADDLLAKLKSGADFAGLARQHSEDPSSKSTGGDIGWFKRGDMMPQIEQAVTALKDKQISPVVETPVGYHIIQKTGEEAGGKPMPFNDVRAQIRGRLDFKKRGDRVKSYVDSLISGADIVYADTSYRLDAPTAAPQ